MKPLPEQIDSHACNAGMPKQGYSYEALPLIVITACTNFGIEAMLILFGKSKICL